MSIHAETHRPFPFPARLFHRESLTSYTQRLLTRNHCDRSHQTEIIQQIRNDTVGLDDTQAWVHAIAIKTGRNSLLRDEHASGWLPTNAERSPRPWHGRFACTHCTHGETITQTPHFDDIVCVPHRRWLGLWGAPDDQHTVGPATIKAQLTFAKLRRNRRINVRLYRVVARALAGIEHPQLAIEDAEPLVFAATIDLITAITRPQLARTVLGAPFAVAHQALAAAVSSIVPSTAESLTRAIWVYLHPTLKKIRDAARVDSPLGSDFDERFPADDATLEAARVAVDFLEPFETYFALTGDTPATAARLFHELNSLRTPDSIRTVRSFTCAKGHTFDYLPPMYDLTTPRAWLTPACGLCTTKPVAEGDDFATACPDLVPRFDLHRNGGLTAADIAVTTQSTYWWFCPSGHSHRASPANMAMGLDSCPLESNRTVVTGINSFIDTHPGLAARSSETWDDQRSPANNSNGSKTLATWICDQGHKYPARYWEISRGKVTCHICKRAAKHAVTYDKSLAARFPDVAHRWHPTLNGSLTPADVTAGAKTIIWWQCDQGHNNQGRVDKRAQGQQCGVCTNKRLHPGINDLATREPMLTLEYHWEKNPLRANEIFSSTHKLHWECFAHGHLHAQTAQHRRESRGCPLCEPADRILNVAEAGSD